MADTRGSPHLARNAALAALVVLGSAAVVTAGAVWPGTATEGCPGGEDWVVAQPLEVAMAGYGPAARSGSPAAPARPGPAAIPGSPAIPGGPAIPGSPAIPGGPAIPGSPAIPGGPAVSGSAAAPGAADRASAAPPAGSAQVAATPLALAGCVDTDRLHPMPIPGDGRG